MNATPRNGMHDLSLSVILRKINSENDTEASRLRREISELRRAIMGAEPMEDLRHGQFLEMAAELHQHQRGHENSVRAIGKILRLCDDNGLGDKARELMEGIGDE